MLEGDILLCKKEKFECVVGEYYPINMIVEDFIWLSTKHTQVVFNFDPRTYYYPIQTENTYYPWLWKYFYTPQETRKLKLKELDEI